MWLSVTNLKKSCQKETIKFQLVPDVISDGGGPQHPEAGVDDENEGEEEDRDVDGDSHRPVLLGQEVKTSKLNNIDKIQSLMFKVMGL